MFAAMKGTVIQSVIYSGYEDDSYPSWFLEILGECDEDGFGNLIWSTLNDEEDGYNSVTFEPYQSIILRNKHGDLYHVTEKQFTENYIVMGMYEAAMKENCVQYFKFEPGTKVKDVPEWIRELIHDEFIVMDFDVRSYYGDDGEYAMSPTCYFIRNWKGQVKYLEVNEFEKHYDVQYPKYF